MQLFATILSFFFLSLAVLPCTDEAQEACSTEIHFHAGHEHEQESHSDFCSPFCSCHCCHAHFMLKDFSYLSTDIEYLGILIPYISHRYTQADPIIWQPPRV